VNARGKEEGGHGLGRVAPTPLSLGLACTRSVFDLTGWAKFCKHLEPVGRVRDGLRLSKDVTAG
jgi:hypothetical protein